VRGGALTDRTRDAADEQHADLGVVLHAADLRGDQVAAQVAANGEERVAREVFIVRGLAERLREQRLPDARQLLAVAREGAPGGVGRARRMEQVEEDLHERDVRGLPVVGLEHVHHALQSLFERVARDDGVLDVGGELVPPLIDDFEQEPFPRAELVLQRPPRHARMASDRVRARLVVAVVEDALDRGLEHPGMRQLPVGSTSSTVARDGRRRSCRLSARRGRHARTMAHEARRQTHTTRYSWRAPHGCVGRVRIVTCSSASM